VKRWSASAFEACQPRFIHVIDSCSTAAIETQTKYGIWARATQRSCGQIGIIIQTSYVESFIGGPAYSRLRAWAHTGNAGSLSRSKSHA
jgi:hypothetical protein